MTTDFAEHRQLAEFVLSDRYPGAVAAFWAGSLTRSGQGTAQSDIDLVILFDRLHAAWRETIVSKGPTVETFVHDMTSLAQFFRLDAEKGLPTLAHMVATGVPLREGPPARAARDLAQATLAAGPPPWGPEEIDRSRYFAGGLLDDLMGSRDQAEVRAVGGVLYQHAFDHLRRAKGAWTARSKWIVRVLREEEGQLGQDYLIAFDALFRDAEPGPAIAVVRRIYEPSGGPLACWRSEAPPHGD